MIINLIQELFSYFQMASSIGHNFSTNCWEFLSSFLSWEAIVVLLCTELSHIYWWSDNQSQSVYCSILFLFDILVTESDSNKHFTHTWKINDYLLNNWSRKGIVRNLSVKNPQNPEIKSRVIGYLNPFSNWNNHCNCFTIEKSISAHPTWSGCTSLTMCWGCK